MSHISLASAKVIWVRSSVRRGFGTSKSLRSPFRSQHPSFDEWWEPFTLGVGPAGAFAATLDPTARARLRELCRKFLPPPPFVVTGKAWAARGIV